MLGARLFGIAELPGGYNPPDLQPAGRSLGALLASPVIRWDGDWYLTIAAHGYAASSGISPTPRANFFPLYPLLVATLRQIGTPLLLASVIVSVGAFTVALYLLARLAELERPRWNADAPRSAVTLTVVSLAVSPFSFFFSAAYAESVYLAVSVGAFLCGRRGRWWLAGTLAGLASAARAPGVLLFAPLVVLYLYGPRADLAPDRADGDWRPRYRLRRDFAGLLLAPAGLAAYSRVSRTGWRRSAGLRPYPASLLGSRHSASMDDDVGGDTPRRVGARGRGRRSRPPHTLRRPAWRLGQDGMGAAPPCGDLDRRTPGRSRRLASDASCLRDLCRGGVDRDADLAGEVRSAAWLSAVHERAVSSVHVDRDELEYAAAPSTPGRERKRSASRVVVGGVRHLALRSLMLTQRDPTLSPDGSELAYVSGTQATSSIWIVPASGTAASQFPAGSTSYDGAPDWQSARRPGPTITGGPSDPTEERAAARFYVLCRELAVTPARRRSRARSTRLTSDAPISGRAGARARTLPASRRARTPSASFRRTPMAYRRRGPVVLDARPRRRALRPPAPQAVRVRPPGRRPTRPDRGRDDPVRGA